jgi:hypothetical protein
MTSNKSKETRGGKRIGSGRKKSKYETKIISFRVRIEFIEQIKEIVKDYIFNRIKLEEKK